MQIGCQATDEIVISETGPIAAFTSDPSTGAQTGVTISFTDQSQGTPVTWNWNFGDNQSAATQNTSHAYQTEGDLTVSLVVTDANGCKDTISKAYVISNSVAVPNSFTPNGDGFNDFFVVRGSECIP